MHKLPKAKKILTAQEFKQTMNYGKKFVVSELVLFASKNPKGHTENRLGLVVTKKLVTQLSEIKLKEDCEKSFDK